MSKPCYSRKGSLRGRRVWDKQATRELALSAQATIEKRAFEKGHGSDDTGHKAYSTKPIYIPKKGVMPKPRGGRPVKKRNPTTGRMNLSLGKSVYYEGGYAEYKLSSTGKGGVTLTRTGKLRRSFRIKRLSRFSALLGLSGHAAVYGTFVQRDRPWMALSAKDRATIRRGVGAMVGRAIRRSASQASTT